MAYKAIIARLTNVRPHSNADRLELATVCGNQVIISKGHQDGELGVYFDVDGVLSDEYCKENNLYSDNMKNSDTTKKGYFTYGKARVRAQNFRGERSVGMWMPIESLDSFTATAEFSDGDEFDMIEGVEICKKWINPATQRGARGVQKTARKKNVMFAQHFDTEQFGRKFHDFPTNVPWVITEKLHGTSQRIGRVLVPLKPKGFFAKAFDAVARFFKPDYEPMTWDYVVGTRRVELSDERIHASVTGNSDISVSDGSSSNSYHGDDFRRRASELFFGNLKKGEVVYYEVIGYEREATTIMPVCNTEKLKKHLDKESYEKFKSMFGDSVDFTYGVDEGELDIYVYRITRVNEDGDAVDLPWEAVKKRCSELGVKHVPELLTFIPDHEFNVMMSDVTVHEVAASTVKYYSGDDISDGRMVNSQVAQRQLKEGVCVRVEGYPHCEVLKEKNFFFKVLEGIIKDSGVVDTEEVESNASDNSDDLS